MMHFVPSLLLVRHAPGLTEAWSLYKFGPWAAPLCSPSQSSRCPEQTIWPPGLGGGRGVENYRTRRGRRHNVQFSAIYPLTGDTEAARMRSFSEIVLGINSSASRDLTTPLQPCSAPT